MYDIKEVLDICLHGQRMNQCINCPIKDEKCVLTCRSLLEEIYKRIDTEQAKWEYTTETGAYELKCSRCGFIPGIRFYESNYCPNCGAKIIYPKVEIINLN